MCNVCISAVSESKNSFKRNLNLQFLITKIFNEECDLNLPVDACV